MPRRRRRNLLPFVLSAIPVALTFSEVPRELLDFALGKSALDSAHAGVGSAGTLQLEYPREGIDLEIQVTWPPAEKPAALRVRITDPDGNEHEKTIWGRGEMDEVLTFP
jgi:hypothetical protein